MFLESVKRIIAIGDVHGDLQFARRCLLLAKVIDKNDRWIGGQTVVIQTGDQLDRARDVEIKAEEDHDDMEILDYFDALATKAKAHGGNVISLCGNHELMQCFGDLDYVSQASLVRWLPAKLKKKIGSLSESEIETAKSKRAHDFQPGSKQAIRLARTRPAYVIVGGWLFAHSGITTPIMHELGISDRKSLERINREVHDWLTGKSSVEEMPEQKIDSIFWDRTLGNLGCDAKDARICSRKNKSSSTSRSSSGTKSNECVTMVDPVLKALGVRGIVVGHTVQEGGITSACDETVFRIDFGGSAAFSPFLGSGQQSAQVLQILNDKDVTVLKDDVVRHETKHSSSSSSSSVSSSLTTSTYVSSSSSSPSISKDYTVKPTAVRRSTRLMKKPTT